MTTNIITAHPPNRIWVTRDWHRYTHKIYRNGVLVAFADIDRTRAEEIINANPGGYTIGHEPLDFTGAMAQFTFEIPIEESSNGSQ